MGNNAFFVSFKNRTKEDVVNFLRCVDRDEFSSYATIQGIITFSKSIGALGIKRGETYLMTYGCRYWHRDMDFLDSVPSIDPSECRLILGDYVYDEIPESKSLSDYGEIVEFDWDDYEHIECECVNCSNSKLYYSPSNKDAIKDALMNVLSSKPHWKLNMEFLEEELYEGLKDAFEEVNCKLDTVEMVDGPLFVDEYFDLEEGEGFISREFTLTCVDEEGETFTVDLMFRFLHTCYDFKTDDAYGIFGTYGFGF